MLIVAEAFALHINKPSRVSYQDFTLTHPRHIGRDITGERFCYHYSIALQHSLIPRFLVGYRPEYEATTATT